MNMTSNLTTALFWNVWGHRNPEKIHSFIQQHQPDFCCLTEVTKMGQAYYPVPRVHSSTYLNEPASYINGLERLQAEFEEMYDIKYHSPHMKTSECVVTGGKYLKVGFGSAMMIKNGIILDYYEDIPILNGIEGVRERVMQVAVFVKAGHKYLIAHLHGVWLKDNTKGDDAGGFRALQSMQVREHLERIAKKDRVKRIVFGGDLNLDINTQALRLLEVGDGTGLQLQNHIRLRGIDNTRTIAYRKFHILEESKYADYVHTTQEVNMHGLLIETANDASDHAPLLTTFS